MSIKLSICIATRNRANCIGDTLRSIVEQSDHRVEIVVLDGASTDRTGEVVAEWQAKFPSLRYQRNASNGGVDRDYDAAVQLASGEFCWLMSDDDLLKPGAVAAVLAEAEADRSLIVVNSELRSIDLTELLDARRLQWKSNRIYSADEFAGLFADVSAYLTYIGAVVIRRGVWLSRPRERYFGSYFIHVGVIFHAPLPGATVVLCEPLVSVRFGNTQWRPKEFEIRMVRWTELIWALDRVPEASKTQLYRREPWRSLKSLMFYRAKGTYDIGEYRRWVRPRVQGLGDRLCAWAVARLPGVLANAVGLIYCRFPYRDSNIHLLDMRASRYFVRNWFKRWPVKT